MADDATAQIAPAVLVDTARNALHAATCPFDWHDACQRARQDEPRAHAVVAALLECRPVMRAEAPDYYKATALVRAALAARATSGSLRPVEESAP